MTVVLSNADVQRLTEAMAICLSPLEYRTPEDWGHAVMRATQALVGADQGFLSIPRIGQPDWFVVQDDNGAAAGQDYVAHYVTLDLAVQQRRHELGLQVYHRDMLYQPEEMKTDPVLNEWCPRYKLFDTIGMSFDVAEMGSLPALIHVYRDHGTREGAGDHGVLLLQLLLPAFKAGVHAFRDHWHLAADLGRLLDQMPAAVALFDVSGRLVHCNTALVKALAAEQPPRCQILVREAGAVARSLLAIVRGGISQGIYQPPPSVPQVVTRDGRYTMLGTLIRSSTFAPRPHVLVTVIPVTPRSATDGDLRMRYGLTPREIVIARLVSDGLSAPAIGGRLGISRHTVRHHIEHVTTKLNVHTRAAVGAALRGE